MVKFVTLEGLKKFASLLIEKYKKVHKTKISKGIWQRLITFTSFTSGGCLLVYVGSENGNGHTLLSIGYQDSGNDNKQGYISQVGGSGIIKDIKFRITYNKQNEFFLDVFENGTGNDILYLKVIDQFANYGKVQYNADLTSPGSVYTTDVGELTPTAQSSFSTYTISSDKTVTPLADIKYYINTNGVKLTLNNSPNIGQEITVIAKADSMLVYNDNTGNKYEKSLPAGSIFKLHSIENGYITGRLGAVWN